MTIYRLSHFSIFALLIISSVCLAEVIGKPKPTRLADLQFPIAKQWVNSGNGVPLGVSVRTDRGMTLTFADGREFLLDRFGMVVVAEDAGNFVTFTPQAGQVPEGWSLAFFDATGKLVGQDLNRHGYSKLAVSANGRTVGVSGVIRPPRGASERQQQEFTGLVLYDGNGDELASSLFAPETRTTAVTVDDSGQWIAVGLGQGERRRDDRWQLRVYRRSGQALFSLPLNQPAQGLRFVGDGPALLVLVPGGVRVLDLETEGLGAVIRLPADHYIAGPGRVYLRGRKVLAVAEYPSRTQEGISTWSLLAADENAAALETIAEGESVPSRHSPALSMLPRLGAKEWPVLVTTDRILTIDPTQSVKKK